MKKYFCFVVLIVAVLAFNSSAREKFQLKVEVTGLESNNGKVMIALVSSKEEYDSKDAEPCRFGALEIEDKKAQWVVSDLGPGEYAIKLYHDENGNGKMDKNFMGMPKEGYGFSNNAPVGFGPPSFEDASFSVKDSVTIQKIEIQ